MNAAFWSRWHSLAQRKEMLPAWLVALLALAATLMFWNYARHENDRVAKAAFEGLTQRFVAEVERNMTAYEQILRAGVGLFRTGLNVTGEDWKSFVGALDLTDRYAGSRGVGYAVMIPAADLQAHLSALRERFGATYQVWPNTPTRDVYSSVVLVEPADDMNVRAVGFDMLTEPIRRAAMDRARDTGLISSTAKVRLIVQDDNDPGSAFLIYEPVYRTGRELLTQDDRRAALQGFVYMALRMDDFIGSIMTGPLVDVGEQLRIKIYDGLDATEKSKLYDGVGAAAASGKPAFAVTTPYDQNGRNWTFEFSSRPAFESASASSTPSIILLIGSVVTLLVTALAASLANRHIEQTEANARMALLTRELSHRVKNTLAIVQSIANRSLTAGRSTAEGREIFGKRLHALARAHTFLLNNSWSGADLKELVTSELAAFGARATVKGPDVKLRPQLAQTFALVIHELATNAVKHGSLSCENGRVVVGWKIARNAGERVLRFSWREVGGPPAREPTSSGFGQTLLRQALVHGAAGAPQMTFGEDGFQYRFETPVADTLTDDAEDDDTVALGRV